MVAIRAELRLDFIAAKSRTLTNGHRVVIFMLIRQSDDQSGLILSA
jgi:hypothetical protein